MSDVSFLENTTTAYLLFQEYESDSEISRTSDSEVYSLKDFFKFPKIENRHQIDDAHIEGFVS